jgi:hypothetical protein
MMTKKTKTILITTIAAVVLLLFAGFVHNAFFRPAPLYGGNQNVLGLLIFGLLTGATIAYLVFRLQNVQKNGSKTVISSHTVVESMKRVFKIVVAEGQLNEIYNYENTKKLLNFIPSTKKALVIVRAKVLIGYDIEKCKWKVDEKNRKIHLISFPKPEILSIDPDFNYYYFEDDLFNFIGRKDLSKIQELAKEQTRKAALQSSLMKFAAEQMKTLLTEVMKVNDWQLENVSLIDDYAYLPEPKEEEKTEEMTPMTTNKEPIVSKVVNFLNKERK